MKQDLTIIEQLQAISDIVETDGMVLGVIWSDLKSVENGHLPGDMIRATYDKIQTAMQELADHLHRLDRYPNLSDEEWTQLKARNLAAIAAGEVPF